MNPASRDAVIYVPSPAKPSTGKEGATLAIEDLSHLRRTGLKGPRAADWLRERGIAIPDAPNEWRPLADDSDVDVIARLGNSEFLIEQAAPGSWIERIEAELATPTDGVYPVLREDCTFVLRGAGAVDVLAQVCNVDFSSVSPQERRVVMTMMIGVAVLVIPQAFSSSSGNDAPSANAGYRIWCDPSYGNYVWSSLQDVVQTTHVGEAR